MAIDPNRNHCARGSCYFVVVFVGCASSSLPPAGVCSPIYTPREGRLRQVTLQMKGRKESNINVWFRFMYSQKGNNAACYF